MMVRLDLNNPEFQAEWFALQKEDFIATRNTLRKLCSMNWNQVYRDKGLRWEKIRSLKTDKGLELYTVRPGRKHRAVVCRKEAFMIFVSLHPDHDSAYK